MDYSPSLSIYYYQAFMGIYEHKDSSISTGCAERTCCLWSRVGEGVRGDGCRLQSLLWDKGCIVGVLEKPAVLGFWGSAPGCCGSFVSSHTGLLLLVPRDVTTAAVGRVGVGGGPGGVHHEMVLHNHQQHLHDSASSCGSKRPRLSVFNCVVFKQFKSKACVVVLQLLCLVSPRVSLSL